jgi:hypothetical protein
MGRVARINPQSTFRIGLVRSSSPLIQQGQQPLYALNLRNNVIKTRLSKMKMVK